VLVETLAFVVGRDSAHIDAAAQVWSEAVAARDSYAEVPAADVTRPLIERIVASSPRSVLLIASDAAGDVVAFAAAKPVDGAAEHAHVRYIGVRPGRWGAGAGRQLVAELAARLRSAGYAAARLEVYVDNPRAVRLYERLGWVPHGDPTPHPSSGRLEQEYRLALQR
jgi:ribosomal protein S18 acetylase RimI-like enzyme